MTRRAAEPDQLEGLGQGPSAGSGGKQRVATGDPAWVAREALPGGQAPGPEESALADAAQLWGARIPGECGPRHPHPPGFAQATGLDGRSGTRPPSRAPSTCQAAPSHPGPGQTGLQHSRRLGCSPQAACCAVRGPPERRREETQQAAPCPRWGRGYLVSPSLAQAVKHFWLLAGLCAEAAADQLPQDHRGNGSSTASNPRPGRRLRQVCAPREPTHRAQDAPERETRVPEWVCAPGPRNETRKALGEGSEAFRACARDGRNCRQQRNSEASVGSCSDHSGEGLSC